MFMKMCENKKEKNSSKLIALWLKIIKQETIVFLILCILSSKDLRFHITNILTVFVSLSFIKLIIK